MRIGRLRASLYSTSVTVGCTALAVLANQALRKRGAPAGVTRESTILGVPFGLVGGRLYHLATSWGTYFGPDGRGPRQAANLSLGGLGSWGVVPGAAVGTAVVCRARGVRFPVYLDSYAPAMVVAVVAVRIGNWCNQELYGHPTTRAWGVRIDPENRPEDAPESELFHPVFLYESLGAIAITPVIVGATRRWELGHGRSFALWVGLYSTLRFGLEFIRADKATIVAGARVNMWVSTACVAGAATYITVVGRTRPGIETTALRG